MTVDDRVSWLRAQLDDDAAMFAALDSTALNGIDSTAGWNARVYVERIPAEVDAKRRILALAASITDQHDDEQVWYQQAIGDVLRLLALPYADRPGYRPEWAPNA